MRPQHSRLLPHSFETFARIARALAHWRRHVLAIAGMLLSLILNYEKSKVLALEIAQSYDELIWDDLPNCT